MLSNGKVGFDKRGTLEENSFNLEPSLSGKHGKSCAGRHKVPGAWSGSVSIDDSFI